MRTEVKGMKVTAGEREFELAEAPCSCCGLAPERSEYFDTVRAGLVDSDGVYFSYLCCERDGAQVWGGCLEEVLREQERRGQHRRQVKANLLRELLGDDQDAIHTEMGE